MKRAAGVAPACAAPRATASPIRAEVAVRAWARIARGVYAADGRPRERHSLGHVTEFPEVNVDHRLWISSTVFITNGPYWTIGSSIEP